VPASVFHLTDRGRIAKGLRADLLLVKGDPTRDVTATRAIVAVWKLGVTVDREEFRTEIARTRTEVDKLRQARVCLQTG
jgi:adenine deaminase